MQILRCLVLQLPAVEDHMGESPKASDYKWIDMDRPSCEYRWILIYDMHMIVDVDIDNTLSFHSLTTSDILQGSGSRFCLMGYSGSCRYVRFITTSSSITILHRRTLTTTMGVATTWRTMPDSFIAGFCLRCCCCSLRLQFFCVCASPSVRFKESWRIFWRSEFKSLKSEHLLAMSGHLKN